MMPAAKPPEFRRRAVELARLGERPIAKIAKDLGVSEGRDTSGEGSGGLVSRRVS